MNVGASTSSSAAAGSHDNPLPRRYVPEPPNDTIFLEREGHTVEVTLASVTPNIVAQAFNVSISMHACVLGSTIIVIII